VTKADSQISLALEAVAACVVRLKCMCSCDEMRLSCARSNQSHSSCISFLTESWWKTSQCKIGKKGRLRY